MRRWQLTEHVFLIHEWYITMLWPLSCHDDDWRSIFHNLWINNHALTVVMRRWQLTVHVSYLRGIYHHNLTVVLRRWQLREHDSYMNDNITMLWPLSCVDDQKKAWFIPKGYMTMLCPLSSDDDDWWSMFHTLLMNDHALTVGMTRWQLTDNDSDLRDIWSCSIRCHETKTTDGACFIHGWYITMLCPLSWDDDNWRSMFHTWTIYIFALSIVMRRWKLTEHVSHLFDKYPYSDRCHETMTTDGAYFSHEWYIAMLWPLAWDDDNWRSMVHNLGMINHALSVVMRRWILTEHVSYMNDILPCSDPCHAMKTTDRACLTPLGWIPILWPLSWDDDNWRSLFLTWMVYSYALTIGMRWLQLTEHGSYLRYD